MVHRDRAEAEIAAEKILDPWGRYRLRPLGLPPGIVKGEDFTMKGLDARVNRDWSVDPPDVRIVESEIELPAEPYEKVKYSVNKKKTTNYIIREVGSGDIVRVESSEDEARRWKGSHSRGRKKFELRLDDQLISTHGSYPLAEEAVRSWKSKTASDIEETLSQFRDPRERAAARARIDARDRLSIKEAVSPGPSYEIETRRGHVVKEVRTKGGKNERFKPIAVYDDLGEANSKVARLEEEMEWKESVGGRLTETPEEAAAVRESRERAVAAAREEIDQRFPRLDVPESVEEMEQILRKDMPEREPVRSILDRELPEPPPVEELSGDQALFFNELKKLAEKGIQKRGYYKFRQEFVKAIDEDGDFANFDHAMNVINIAMTPDLMEAAANNDLGIARKIVAGRMHHETVHGLSRLSLFRRREWKALVKFAGKLKIKPERLAKINEDLAAGGIDPLPEGSTYLDLARSRYAERGDRQNWIDEDYNEEAVAMLFADWAVNRKVAPGQPGGLFNRIVDMFRSLSKSLKGLWSPDPMNIMEDIYTGNGFAKRMLHGKIGDTWYARRPGQIESIREQIELGREAISLKRDEAAIAGLAKEEQVAPDSQAIMAKLNRDKDITEEGIDSPIIRGTDARKMDPFTGEVEDKSLSIRDRLKQRYRFKGDIPEDANQRVDHPPGYESKMVSEYWGKLPFNRMGGLLKNPRARIYVPKGYREEGDRGYGKAALDAWNPAIERDTNYGNWQELLDHFFRDLKKETDASRPENIRFDPQHGRITAVWKDPLSQRPITLVFDVDEETADGEYFVVAARPSRALVQPPGSIYERQGSPSRRGPNVSASAVYASLGDEELSPKDRKAFALVPPDVGDLPGESMDGLEGMGLKSQLEGRSPLQHVFMAPWEMFIESSFFSSGVKRGFFDAKHADKFYTLDKIRKGYADRWARLHREELLAKGLRVDAGAEAYFENLSNASAEAAIYDFENSRKYLSQVMREGYVIYLDGVSEVGGYDMDIDGNILREGHEDMDPADPNRIWDRTGRPSLNRKGHSMVNDIKIRGFQDFKFNIDGREIGDGDTYSADIFNEGDVGGALTVANSIPDSANYSYDDLVKFQIAKRARNLLKDGMKVPIDPKNIEPWLRKAEDSPEILVLAENYERWNDGVLELGVATGYLNQSDVDYYKRYHDHIPFFPAPDSEAAAGLQSPIMRVPGLPGAKGLDPYVGFEDRPLQEPFEAIAKNTLFLLQNSLRTVAKNRVINNGLEIGTMEVIPMEDFDPEDKHQTTSWILGEETAFLVTDPMTAVTLIGHLEGHDPFVGGMVSKAARSVSGYTRDWITRGINFIFRNPMRDSVEIAVSNGGIIPFFTPAKIILGKLAYMYKRRKDPSALPAVEFLELERLGKTTRYEHAGSRDAAMGLSFKSDAKSEDFELPFDSQMAKMLGGDSLIGGVGFSRKVAAGKGGAALPFKLFLSLWDTMGEVSTYGEMAVRERVYANEYKETLQGLMDRGVPRSAAERMARGEGARQAEEIINFNKFGDFKPLRLLTAHTAFFNAKIIGFDRFLRVLLGGGPGGGPGLSVVKTARGRDRAKKAMAARVALAMVRRGGTVAALSALLGMWTNDDEHKKAYRLEESSDNWIIPLPDNPFLLSLTLPTGFESGILMKSLPEAIARGFQDRMRDGEIDSDAFKTTMAHAFRQGMPLSELFMDFPNGALSLVLAPQILKLPAQIVFNYDYFRKEPIVQPWDEGLGSC